MAKKCIYCSVQIDENSVVDVCRRCGIGVWGEKMFGAIVENMSNARDSGDLYQGSVGESVGKPKEQVKRNILVEDSAKTHENNERMKILEEQHVEVRPVTQSDLFSSVKTEEKPHEIEILSSSNEITPKSEDVLGSLN